VPAHVSSACTSQLEYLRDLRHHWRLDATRAFQVPEEWKPVSGRVRIVDNIDPIHDIAAQEMAIWLSTISDRVTFLSREETMHRHLDYASSAPDFLLWPRRPHEPSIRASQGKCFSYDPRVSLIAFKDVVHYMGGKQAAAAAIPGMFTSIPSCWLRCNPGFDFPPMLGGCDTPPPVDFAVLLQTIGPSDYVSGQRSASLRVNALHSALLMGAQGPATWPGSRPSDGAGDLEIKIHDLAFSVHSSLNCHILNWYLRCQQTLDQTPGTSERGDLPEKAEGLPRHLVIFGIMYDADCIRIIAHLPYLINAQGEPHRFSYLSCVVDTLPFAPVGAPRLDSQTFSAGRFQAAFALLTMRKHAFRLASMWEGVLWPTAFTASEMLRESEYLGPSPYPSSSEASSMDESIERSGKLSEMWPVLTASDDEEELLIELEKVKEKRPVVQEWALEVGEASAMELVGPSSSPFWEGDQPPHNLAGSDSEGHVSTQESHP